MAPTKNLLGSTPPKGGWFPYMAYMPWIILGSLSLFYILLLGYRPFETPDEGRYVQIGMEIATSGDWLTPRLNGIKYFEKPPLVYWILAIFAKLFGVSEFSMRLVPALFGLGGIGGTCFFATRLFGVRIGQLSALMTGTSLLYFALSRLIILDIAVSTFMAMALFSTMMAFDARYKAQSTRYKLLVYLFISLGVLAKGLVALALTGTVVCTWMLLTRRWEVLSLLYWIPGIILFCAISVPWHVLVSLANPEFPAFYFIHEHFERYTSKVHGRYQPLWFYLPILVAGLFPWTQFLPQALKQCWQKAKENENWLFLLIWAGVIFVFYSISHSKLIPYILPVIPALSIMMAQTILSLDEKKDRKSISRHFRIFQAIQIFLLVALVGVVFYEGIPLLQPYIMISALLLIGLAVTTHKFATTEKLSNIIAHWPQLPIKMTHLIILMTGTVVVLYICAENLSMQLRRPSLKPIIEKIQQEMGPEDHIYMHRRYYYELPVYAKKRIPIIAPYGELSFGADQDDPVKDTTVHDVAQLQKAWRGPGRVFLFLRDVNVEVAKNFPPDPVFVYAKIDKEVILTNRQ